MRLGPTCHKLKNETLYSTMAASFNPDRKGESAMGNRGFGGGNFWWIILIILLIFALFDD